MKNPNGFGTVVRLSGNRRKPYAVRKTIGWNDKGYPIQKAIGYAATREEGLIMLAEYNKKPYDIDARRITVKEVYEKWRESASKKLSKSSLDAAQTAFRHSSALHNLPYAELRAFHIKDCIDSYSHFSYATQNNIRTFFINLDKYALEHDIVERCYASLVEYVPIPETSKRRFTEEDIQKVWEHADDPWVDTLLIYLYSGWRRMELLTLTRDDIDLEAQTMQGGLKTKNGKNRIVPIHPRIFPFIKTRYENTKSGKLIEVSDQVYRARWLSMMEKLEMNYTTHECRHTFRSRLDSAGANKVCIDLLMGHKSGDVGERIYTHKTIEELRSTILLLN